jgi:predicted nucleotidyltransferase
MSFRRLTSNRNILQSMKDRTTRKPIQNLIGIRRRCPELMNDPKCKPLCWVGVFGSFARNQQRATSGVDIIIGYTSNDDEAIWDQGMASYRFVSRAPKIFGRKVDVLHLFPQHVTSYAMLEALLTCVTVYGLEDWHDSARTKARSMLDEGYGRLRNAYHLIWQIEKILETANKNVSQPC